MRNDSPIADVLHCAVLGSDSAWREIHARYSSLVLWVCRGYGVTGADADDVSGNVWLHLVTSAATIRTPEALPFWLKTTAQRECVRLLRHRRRQVPREVEVDRPEPASDESLLTRERRDIVREALGLMPERDRELLSLLFSDPPTPYSRISSALGMPIGAIGPTRQRCLARMRRIPSIKALRLRSA